VNSHGQEPLETVPDDEASEASDGCGRSATRGLFQGVILEMENGDREGIFYGAILGRVRFHPSVGISFIFEHGEGMWKVTISGNNLGNLHRELVLGRRESVRCGDAVQSIGLKAWSPSGKK
jgi:hypothetical protein